ncbi:MAG TPA: HD domain-containing protein, partial [Terriglobia bacterium]|nr:HD domain-containing protein [Terriglobia bacterium]
MDAQTARVELKSFIETEKAAFLTHPGFGPLEETICRKVDDVVLQLWKRIGGLDVPGFALLAVGGYGRGTLHPESDLDLLLFFKDVVNETVVKNVLDPLWDLPFRVGHQIRQASDFKSFDSTHIESYAAFLDSRFLVGNAPTAAEFQKVILPGFVGRNRDAFLRGLIDSKKQRYVRFGETIFQLEPDLKDAPGGVRDFHWADWIRKALDAPPEPHSTDVLSFHHCMRNYLHFQAGRNLNTLSYEFQEQIAPQLGYTESPHGEAEETMMRDYFLRAGEIARRASMWEEEVAGSPNRIAIRSDFNDPFEMIEAFAQAHNRKSGLHAVTLGAIRNRLSSLDGVLENNPKAGRAVIEMMKDRNGIYDTLLAMHEVGLLGKIFPDFEEIRCRVIRDFFHMYTVDEHSLIAIRHVEKLPARHRFSVVLQELEHPELLLLSLLFHDIGKAHKHDPRNHVHPSTVAVKVILEKLELPLDQAAKVTAAIKNHLEMSKIVLKRDFSDESVIIQFADLVGSVDDLRMLCLLTYADIKAVNNEVLTPWKEDLLWQLYVETYNRLMLGLADDRYDQQPSLESDIESVLKELPRKTNAQDVREFLDGVPRQYLKNTPKNQIAEHFVLSRKLASVPMVAHLARRDGLFYEVLVMTADRPYLFSKITGVLSYFGMNILRGQAFSNRGGTISDVISFEDVDNYFAKNPSEIQRFHKVLNDVIAGAIGLDQLLKGKMTSVLFRQKKGVVQPT